MEGREMKPLVDVKGLTVRFGALQRPAVNAIDFTIGREKLGVVGESGSGKSTTGRALMRLLPRYARITADTLLYDGRSLSNMPERRMAELRGRDMALIMQDPRYSLNPVLRVGTQVAESARLHLGVNRAQARERAAAMLERVRIRNVGEVMDLYPHQLSGGMGQRVMIAMMLLPKPRLVIADEPTSALDVSVRQDVLTVLQDLVAEDGSSLLLISHDIRMVDRFCDRMLVMHKGEIVETLSDLDEARHSYTRQLIEAIPDPRHPVRRLRERA